jgi:hypothetical protein
MASNSYTDALNRALNAELLQWGGSESTTGSWRSGRTLAALIFGASAAVTAPEDPRPVAPSAPQTTTTQTSAVARVVPAYYRPAPDRFETVARVLATAQERLDSGRQPARAVAALALEIGRLQRDLGVRSHEGMEEWVGEAYASLEAVRRAVCDSVVDGEAPAVMEAALSRAAELVGA